MFAVLKIQKILCTCNSMHEYICVWTVYRMGTTVFVIACQCTIPNVLDFDVNHQDNTYDSLTILVLRTFFLFSQLYK